MAEIAVPNNHFRPKEKGWKQDLWLLPAAFIALYMGRMVAQKGLVPLVMMIGLPIAIGFLVLVFLKPRYGLLVFMVYSFAQPGLGRHIAGQWGLLYDAILLIIWLALLFFRSNRFQWRHLNNDLMWLCVAWFGFSVLELGNPSRPNPQGWLQEVRGLGLYWLMLTPLVFFLLNKRKDLTLFLHIIIILSVVGAVYGIKQLYIGVDSAEHAWLEAGAKKTHMLFGKLRVFSFFSESAQFGASQGQLAIMSLVLAVGPYSRYKKVLYTVAFFLIFYGMLISGTRGAMGALVGGGFVFLVISKNVRLLITGGIVGLLFIGFLKFTTIANNNDQIRRLRSSTNADDPSLLARLINQRRLSDYLQSRPFGTGVGTIGIWGDKFNPHIPISKVPPDSLFVKIWVEYGVIGFIFWLGMILFIIGKSAGIVWKTRDPVLRNQLIALTAGSFGALVCSYGNEVLNQMPTSMVVYISWVLIWLSPRWDTKPGEVVAAPGKKEHEAADAFLP